MDKIDKAIQKLFSIFSRYEFSITSEKKTQVELANCLDSNKIQYQREFTINPGSNIDFIIHDEISIGMEVKIKGNAESIYAQCARYCETQAFNAFILITAKSIGFPVELHNVPCYYFSLTKNKL